MGVCSFSRPYPQGPMIPKDVVIRHPDPTLTNVKLTVF